MLHLSLEANLVSAKNRDNALPTQHVAVLLLGEIGAVKFHDSLPANTKVVLVLRVHDVPKRILIFRPGDSTLNHGDGVESHGLERLQCLFAQRSIRVGNFGGNWYSGRTAARIWGEILRRL